MHDLSAAGIHEGLEAACELQNWLEVNLPDDIWEKIPVDMWNKISLGVQLSRDLNSQNG
jgi:hypothetical protein